MQPGATARALTLPARLRTRIVLGVAVAVGCAGVLAPAGRAANVVVGDTALGSTPGFATIGVSAGIPVFQGHTSGDYALSAPVSGTIVSWSFRAGTIAIGTFRLRVLRPADTVGTSWTAVGTSRSVTISANASLDDALQGPFSDSVPIQAGDRIALEPVDGPDVPTEQGVSNHDGVRYFTAAFSDGTTAAIDPNSTADNGQIIPIQATIQPTPPTPPPANEQPPTITGIPRPGQTLTCQPGTWAGNPTSFAYEWQLDGQALTGQTGQTYAIANGDVGHRLTCHVAASNAGGSGSATSAAVTPAVVQPPPSGRPAGVYELRVQGIEVIQSVQTKVGSALEFLPSFAGASIPSPYFSDGSVSKTLHQARYWGVDLAAGQPTFARVYVDLAAGTPLPGVTVQLTAIDSITGRALPGSPLLPLYGPSTVSMSGSPFALESERRDSSGAFVFQLPASWTQSSDGFVDLVGVASGPPRSNFLHPRTECTDSVCQAETSFRLTGVSFDTLPSLRIAPVNMSPASPFALHPQPETLPPPSQVFARVAQMMPGGNRYTVLPYQGWIDTYSIEQYNSKTPQCASYTTTDKKGNIVKDALGNPVINVVDCKNDAYYSAILNWTKKNPAVKTGGRYNYDLVVGVNTRSRGEATVARTINNLPYDNPTHGDSAAQPAGFVNTSRPVTSVMHEIGHMLGLAHAGLGTIDANGKYTCPDTAAVTGGEDWQPDNYGRLQGWEGYVGSVLASSLHESVRFYEREDTDANPLYDLMSYCAGTDDLHNLNAWLSPHNWQRELRALQSFGNRLAGQTTFSQRQAADPTAHAGAGLLEVTGIVNSHGGYISDVAPTTAPVTATTAAVTVRAYNSAGGLIATSSADVEPGDAHAGELPSAHFNATVPAGASRVELVSGGQVLDARSRPAHPPLVRVMSPAAGSLIGQAGTVRIRWAATKALHGAATDGPHQPLLTSIDYSRDGGRSWRTVVEGVTGSAVTVPSGLLAASQHARLRVRVSDGFNESVSVSRVFRSAGAPPQSYIDMPVAGEQLVSSATLSLQGGAVDDSGSQLTGGSLSWYDGRRLIGHGASQNVDGLTPGAHTIALRARDRGGRTGSSTVRVLVTAVAPQVLSLRAPITVSRHAPYVRIGIAVSEPSLLILGKHATKLPARHFVLVKLPLPASNATRIELSLRLRAYGRTLPIALQLGRR